MPKEIERAVLQLVVKILGGTKEPTPDWLMRPGKKECRERWQLICEIYSELTNKKLQETMPPREWRRLDYVLKIAGSASRIIEVDEEQHFNCFRAKTLHLYPSDIKLAFDRNEWIKHSEIPRKLRGGGFGKPKKPLFPDDGGRHLQRAFRDALADILPSGHHFEPTLRIAYFEVEWLMADDAPKRMEQLLLSRGLLN